MMGTLVRKNVFLDPATLKRARAILGRHSESEAIREALELGRLSDEGDEGLRRLIREVRTFSLEIV